MTDGFKASLMTPKLTALKLSKVALQDQLGSYLGRKAKLIQAAGKPGDVAVMTAPDVAARLPLDHAARQRVGEPRRRPRRRSRSASTGRARGLRRSPARC